MVTFECEACGTAADEDNVYILTLPDDSGIAFCSPNCIFLWAQANVQAIQ